MNNILIGVIFKMNKQLFLLITLATASLGFNIIQASEKPTVSSKSPSSSSSSPHNDTSTPMDLCFRPFAVPDEEEEMNVKVKGESLRELAASASLSQLSNAQSPSENSSDEDSVSDLDEYFHRLVIGESLRALASPSSTQSKTPQTQKQSTSPSFMETKMDTTASKTSLPHPIADRTQLNRLRKFVQNRNAEQKINKKS